MQNIFYSFNRFWFACDTSICFAGFSKVLEEKKKKKKKKLPCKCLSRKKANKLKNQDLCLRAAQLTSAHLHKLSGPAAAGPAVAADEKQRQDFHRPGFCPKRTSAFCTHASSTPGMGQVSFPGDTYETPFRCLKKTGGVKKKQGEESREY